MNRKLLLSGSLRPITRFKLRTLFMSLGIVLGVAVLVVTRSMGSAAEQALIEKIERMFSASTIYVGAHGMDRSGKTPVTTLKVADIEAISDAVGEVIAWDPMQVLGAQDVRYGGRSRQLTVYGHSERAETVSGRGVIAGDFFSAEDVRSATRVALLGTNTAEALFGDDDPLGEQIRIGDVFFRVQGVLEPYGVDPHGMDRDDEVQVPITTLMRRLANLDSIRGARLIIDPPERAEEAAARAAEILRQRHAIRDGEADDFIVITPALVRRMVARANRVLKVFLPAGAAVLLLVAALVIANIMLMSVKERVPEIGLRKAVGATDRQIHAQFLIETVAVTLFSGVLGIALGAALITAVSERFGATTFLTPDAVVLALIVASVVGVFSGALPARRAARLDPVEALR